MDDGKLGAGCEEARSKRAVGGRRRREGKKGGRRKNDAPIYQDLLEYVSSNGGTSIRWLKREESDIDG